MFLNFLLLITDKSQTSTKNTKRGRRTKKRKKNTKARDLTEKDCNN